jgi:hypothetical protein
LSLAFQNFAALIKKSLFFKKQKIKILKFRGDRKKLFRKKFLYEILLSVGRINVPKIISQIGDGHSWSLGRFLQKTALKYLDQFDVSRLSFLKFGIPIVLIL